MAPATAVAGAMRMASRMTIVFRKDKNSTRVG
jgi:hypothetical protein